MTGDGVNDAPSLKKADCGIAVEGASDAARTAADVVFLDEGLSTIITSIKVARQIFHRMKAYIIYRYVSGTSSSVAFPSPTAGSTCTVTDWQYRPLYPFTALLDAEYHHSQRDDPSRSHRVSSLYATWL